jgi:hypothetical protein
MQKLTSEQEQNFRKCQQALRESPRPEAFSMECFIRGDCWDARIGSDNVPQFWCGSPACVLGHYALRTDLQDVLILDQEALEEGEPCVKLKHNDQPLTFSDYTFQEHFGLRTSGEAQLLFGPSGCGGAQTPEEAIAYIERFIQERNSGVRP